VENQAATPVGRPGKIVAVGKNYLDHVREMGGSAPTEVPVLFMKPPSAWLGDGEAILMPPQSERVDYEGELVAIIGERLRNVDAATALRGVRGYTCGNDVTARDLQASDGQWTRAKGFDTFSPLGPVVVEGIDPSDLRITTRVNGEVRQESRTSLMIRPVGELIAFISSVMTLEPGDAIFTGTPAGVGPLHQGDVVEVEVEEVGVLRNPVRRAPT
jgi:2-keto-4-pentenoate hydratase/2-oxohepta-3-ene-1,7-dioic acid hydratase in catechol pathway